MNAAIEKILIAGIVLVIGGVVVFDIASIRQAQRLQDTSSAVRHTNRVLYQAQQVLVLNSDYERQAKDFLLSGDTALHDPLWRSAVSLHNTIDSLRALTLDNPVQQTRIDSLLRLTNNNLDLLNRQIRIRQSRGLEAAALASGADTPQRIGSDRIRGVVDALQGEENRLLGLRREVNRQTAYNLEQALTALIVAIAVLALVIFFKFRRDLRREKRAKELLRTFNKELEEQVLLQTAGLKSSEEKYRTIFYKSPLPKWIYDVDTLLFIEVNDASLAQYGYTQQEFETMKLSDLLPKEELGRLSETMRDIRSGDASESRHSYWRQLKKNGEVIYAEFTTHSLQYDHRNARMVVVNDITARRQSEILMQQLNEDLKKRAAELATSNAELERFAYVASHDLQEPLRMVSSFLQLLKKKYQDKLDEKADQYIHYAVDGAERMKTLILDLLEYSRVGSGKGNFTEVNMPEVVDEVIVTFRDKIIAAGAVVATTGPLPVIRAERGQMVQLLQNLVGNALKYRSDQPPMIRISAKEEADQWRFSVSDNGIGIDPSFSDKVFIIFQRLHNKSEYSGTGIGLAICKKIVERHGGRIRVEPGAERGSTFFFTISKYLNH
jgi:PAS domain S-box-containing protein